ncbi:EipA family protein, partial [Klebsiella pneumoniae]
DGTTRDARAQSAARNGADAESAASQTFQKQELLNAAEGTFGKGAAGLAGILERTLKEQGEPNAYIAGREASGAVVVGLRYGKGTMFHKIEGQQPV